MKIFLFVFPQAFKNDWRCTIASLEQEKPTHHSCGICRKARHLFVLARKDPRVVLWDFWSESCRFLGGHSYPFFFGYVSKNSGNYAAPYKRCVFFPPSSNSRHFLVDFLFLVGDPYGSRIRYPSSLGRFLQEPFRWSLNHGNPSYPPQGYPPPRNSRPYDQGLLTIGFP